MCSRETADLDGVERSALAVRRPSMTWLLRVLGTVFRPYVAAPVALRIPLAVVWAATIWILSSGEVTMGTQLPFRALIGNVAHVVIFGILAALCWFSSPRPPAAASSEAKPLAGVLMDAAEVRKREWLGVGCGVVWGVADELHQSTVPGRFASVADVVTDLFGALLAVTVLGWVATGQRRFLRRVPWLVLAAGLSVASATWLHW